MQNKRAVLPVLLVLAGLAFASGANAWSGAQTASSSSGGIQGPGAAQTYNGDPDVPSITQKRLGVAGPSDGWRPTGIGRTWFGHDSVWLRVALSRWFSR